MKMPVFSIHGNHDSPIGLDLFSCMDQLKTNSYVNYFGKVKDLERVIIEPIMFIKGTTKVALFGLGHLNDTRLNILFEKN